MHACSPQSLGSILQYLLQSGTQLLQGTILPTLTSKYATKMGQLECEHVQVSLHTGGYVQGLCSAAHLPFETCSHCSEVGPATVEIGWKMVALADDRW